MLLSHLSRGRCRPSLRFPEARTEAADALQHHKFGGLKGLRRHGHYKDVRLADPFQEMMLHFPNPLAADNWLTSCFGRSLVCTVPTEPLYALDRGRLIKTRCALFLQTSEGPVADFVSRTPDEETGQKWQQFQLIVQAHGFRPQLRTLEDIRCNTPRLQNLERMRQHLVQYVGDPRAHKAVAPVERFFRKTPFTTLGALCDALSSDLLPRGAIECAAISLYRLGAIDMNISEAAYGDQTTLQLL
ncbi:hypothetical protein [Polaromonas sp.]|uniref:hypothetical protein n=1 Tax=Polaromonas sp. TaxID=1869339 RepID=UPI003C935F81